MTLKNYIVFIFLFYFCTFMKADLASDGWRLYTSLELNNEGHLIPMPIPLECANIVNAFADYASNFTKCSVINARPITLCAQCIDHYVSFRDKYKELITKVVNGISCKSIYISHDRLDVIKEYHDSILSIWNKGQCDGCFDWGQVKPELSNDTKTFNHMFEETRLCIKHNFDPTINNTKEVCEKCMANYGDLNNFYKSLSKDGIGVDSVCMDIVDLMNTTRSIWSKNLNCCNLRRSPETVFLCCTALIAMLPVLYYLIVGFCGPIRDLPNVLKQSRFKQMILRSQDGGVN